MIACLVAGKLHADPVPRTSKAGRSYYSATVRVAGSDGEASWLRVAAFSDEAQAALAVLHEGDAVALTGTLRATAYTAKNGEPAVSFDLVADGVLTVYGANQRKAKAHRQPSASKAKAAEFGADDAWLSATWGAANAR